MLSSTFCAMPDQRDPGTPIMNILLGKEMGIDQGRNDYKELRQEIHHQGSLAALPAHVNPARCSQHL
jgi:hypothetical protein